MDIVNPIPRIIKITEAIPIYNKPREDKKHTMIIVPGQGTIPTDKIKGMICFVLGMS